MELTVIEISDEEEVTFYFKGTGLEPFSPREFSEGSKTRLLLEKIENAIEELLDL